MGPGFAVQASARPEPEAAPAELPLSGSSGSKGERQAPREIGDLAVHRFSGVGFGEGITLVERVVGLTQDELIVEYELAGEREVQTVRAHLSRQSERFVSAVRLAASGESPMTRVDFEQFLAKTSYAVDRNLGLLESKSEVCVVGESELVCDRSSFDVVVRDRKATLVVTRSQDWTRDLSGEVRASDGTILYRAELLEYRRDPKAHADQVALLSRR